MKIEVPLFLLGIILTCLGILLVLYAKIPFLSRLPGNITIERENFILNFPLGFCVFLSIILTFVINILISRK